MEKLLNKENIIKKGVIIYSDGRWDGGVHYCGPDNDEADDCYRIGYGCKYYYNIPADILDKVGDLFHELIETWNTQNNYENNIINEKRINSEIDKLAKKYEEKF